MSSSNFQQKALSNRAAIPIISPTSNERAGVRQKLLDGRTVTVPGHQVAVLSEQPQVTYVNPITTVPNAWQGGETWCDVELPNELHIITAIHANITVQGQNSDASGNVLAPTPAWFSRVEVYANGGKDLVETVWNDALYNDAIAWKDIVTLREQADALNVTSDIVTNNASVDANGVPQPPSAAAATPYVLGPELAKNASANYICPINCSLTQAKVFAAGFQSAFRLRFYFSPSIHTVAKGGSKFAPSLQGFSVNVVTQSLSAVNFENQLRQHRNGQVLYKFVLKNRMQYPINNASAGNSYNVQLRSFKSLSSGLVINVTNQAWSDPSNFQDRLPVATLQLLDSVGRRLTEVLPDSYLRRFVTPRHLNTQYPVFRYQYLLPFSSDFGETVRNATNLGYDQLTTLEQLQVAFPKTTDPVPFPANSLNAMVTIYSYDYAALACLGGVGSVQFT